MEDADEPLMTSQIVSTIRLLQIMTAAVCSVNALMLSLDLTSVARANNAWDWQPQYILLRGDIVVVHSVHFTRTKYYVLQIFAVQSN